MSNNNNNNRGESAAGPNQQPPTIQPSEHVAAELAGQTDAEADRASTPKVGGGGGGGDAESIATARPLPKERRERSMRRKDRSAGEERDCRVM
ncbi:hypothetical protein D0869_13226 [Hortaea werneckii]|nr:hypothetical protein KC324_g5072 [Hortaea werneckii]KAI7588431.1 hypothetical protein KC316_g4466 [Hortaea werneckii]RMX73814.1 hypothetical protein D0869_13226 [Hortaea werneckii]